MHPFDYNYSQSGISAEKTYPVVSSNDTIKNFLKRSAEYFRLPADQIDGLNKYREPDRKTI